MHHWGEFGEQVNRLVYALAGRKFQANIEFTNRFIAERINYSESSMRLMRQGRFRPRETQALETLVEIGKTEAELGRDWAYRLLQSGQHSNPEMVLERIYPREVAGKEKFAEPADRLPNLLLVSPIVGEILGSFLALLVWTYAISPVYPAPHELPMLKEILWGLLIGVGLACGIAGSDRWSKRVMWPPAQKVWLGYLALPFSGVLGACLWNGIVQNLFVHSVNNPINSTWVETFSFGGTYGFAFAIGVILAQSILSDPLSRNKLLECLLFFIFITGGLSLSGFVLAILQPSFANQIDVDMFVGIMTRLALIFLVAIWFPHRTGGCYAYKTEK